MREKALTYLLKNPLLHMGMIEPIRRNTADILYADKDGVLIKEQKSNAHMVSVDNFQVGEKLIGSISNCNLIVLHQKHMVDFTLNRFVLNNKLECFQAVYMHNTKIYSMNELEIKQLRLAHLEVILEHYTKLPENEIVELLKNNSIFGGYKNGTLIGFIGNHLEGSIGILEVFPSYRGLGYGTMLESYMVNQMLEKDLKPFAQIEISNKKSLALHNKLGFSISKESLVWIF